MTYQLQSQDYGCQQIRDLLSFYSHADSSAWKSQSFPSSAGHNAASEEFLPLRCDDTLNALNKLGLYRFGCTSSFTSLMIDDQKHIIAETTTPQSSYGKRRPTTRDSGVAFGQFLQERTYEYVPGTAQSASAERSNSVTIPNITVGQGRLIIRDTAEDDTIKEYPCLLELSHTRFYAEVPLYSRSGYVLGTYCIMDGSPRAVFDNTEIEVLEEITASIANHLDGVWDQQKKNRAARMMTGLSQFVHTGHNQPDTQSDYTDAGLSAAVSGISLHKEQSTIVPEIDNLSISTGVLDMENSSHQPSTFGNNIHQDRFDTEGLRKPSTLVSVSDVSVVSHQISTLFAGASSLIRECLDVDGALFLDASRANARRSSSISAPAPEFDLGSLKSQPSPCPLQSASLSSDGTWPNGPGKACEILGFDLDESSVHNTSRSAFSVPDILLYGLVNTFQDGEVFDVQDQNGHEASARQELVSHITDHFPDTKSILFLPLWDWGKSSWLAACVLWSSDSGSLGSRELDYIKAFSNSIISQVAQIDWATKEKAKSDFISSISHELRSPLHGVLASAELLQSAGLQPAQQDMIKMIETCGITLLDTMNYLLDFAKINNLTATGARDKTSRRGSVPDLTATFNLDTLIEEVTNSLYAGHRFPRSVERHTSPYTPEIVRTPRGTGFETKSQDKLSVVTRVEDQDGWTVRSVSGAWRRIAMNLIGNALKFTTSGFIEVTLSKSDMATDPHHALAHLSVIDTGRGISPDFLQNRIFTPFSQEDILSEGVGLGLSIVQQLVTSLGGNVDVKSEVGLGTQVDVFIPIERQTPSSLPVLGTDNQAKKVCLVGFNPFTDVKKTPGSMLSTEAKRKLAVRRSLSNIFLTQPGWMVSFSESLSDGSGDIAVIEEDKLREITMNDVKKTAFERLIVLGDCGSNLSAGSNITMKDEKAIYVTQPIGPRKVIEALKKSCAPPSQRHIEEDTPTRPSVIQVQQPTPKNSSPDISTPKQPASQPEEGHPHVLIVDDNEINVKILETFMRKIGSTYESATDGQIAVEKYQQSQRRFDYVLMDISMPVMDGIEASTKIREYEQENGLQPSSIMAVTGVASASSQQKAFDAGVNNYLVKPVSLKDLKRLMNIQ